MSQSASVVQDVVDRLVLTGTVYDDLIRTLRRRPLSRIDDRPRGCAAAAAAAAEEEEKEPPAAGWTSSELLVELPSLRAFFRSNPTFPPFYVLASCPNVQCRTTRDATVRYYYCHRSAAVGVQQEGQHQAAGDDKDEEQQVTEEEKENKMETVTSSKEEMKDHQHQTDNAPPASATATAVANRPTTTREGKKMQRHILWATFEDQLVAMVQSAPQQRIERTRLQEEYERLHGRRSWTQLGSNKFFQLVGMLKKVKVVPIEELPYLVLSSSGFDKPPVNQEAIDQLEDEFVRLLQSLPGHRVRLSQLNHSSSGLHLSEAYQNMYGKPLRIEPTGMIRMKRLLRAMHSFVKPKGSKKKEQQKYLTLALQYRRCPAVPPPPPPRHSAAAAPPRPPPPLPSRSTSGIARQGSSDLPMTVSAPPPPSRNGLYGRWGNVPPPAFDRLPPGLPPGFPSSALFYDVPPASSGLPTGLPPSLLSANPAHHAGPAES